MKYPSTSTSYRRYSALVALSAVALFVFAAQPSARGAVYGWLDGIDYNGTASGWALDDQSSSAISIDFYLDGETSPCATTTADIYRADVGPHGFRITLPERVRTGGHNLNAVASGYNVQLSGTPQWFDVHTADNCSMHMFSGAPEQIGPDINSIFGGRPLNTYYTNDAKTLTTAWSWQASSALDWQSRGNSPISITAVPRMAGAISSIIWDNVQFIDSGGHGEGLQFVLHGRGQGELYNPTEAGSKADDAVQWWGTSLVALNADGAPTNFYWNGSSSEVNDLSGGNGQPLHTLQRMAYWIPRVPHPESWPYTYDQSVDANGNGINARDAFYSTQPGYQRLATMLDLAQPASNNPLPWFYDNNDGNNQPNEFNNPNALSPYYLEKTVTVGDFGIGNLIKIHGQVTVPSYLSPSPLDDFHLVAFLDKVRFQRVFFFDPATGFIQEQPAGGSGVYSAAPGQRGAVIATSHASADPQYERYAIGMYTLRSDPYYANLPGGGLLFEVGPSNPGGGVIQMDVYFVVGALPDVKSSLVSLYNSIGNR